MRKKAAIQSGSGYTWRVEGKRHARFQEMLEEKPTCITRTFKGAKANPPRILPATCQSNSCKRYANHVVEISEHFGRRAILLRLLAEHDTKTLALQARRRPNMSLKRGHSPTLDDDVKVLILTYDEEARQAFTTKFVANAGMDANPNFMAKAVAISKTLQGSWPHPVC